MAKCDCENWSLEELTNALINMNKGNKAIVVPMFQRGQRWKKYQEEAFIDSLMRGYPVGTMLFYKTLENDKETYILIDGLQRSNSIKKYMTNPTMFFCNNSISDSTCYEILEAINMSNSENSFIVRNILSEFIKKQTSFKSLFSIWRSAGFARIFASDNGNFSPTYCMYFKKNCLSTARKDG